MDEVHETRKEGTRKEKDIKKVKGTIETCYLKMKRAEWTPISFY